MSERHRSWQLSAHHFITCMWRTKSWFLITKFLLFTFYELKLIIQTLQFKVKGWFQIFFYSSWRYSATWWLLRHVMRALKWTIQVR
jgi:hypothetical protein